MVLRGILLLAALMTFCSPVQADTLKLYNGREFNGLVRETTDDAVTLDIGIGVVKFRRWEVQEIEHWSEAENEDLRQTWMKKRITNEARSVTPLRSPDKG